MGAGIFSRESALEHLQRFFQMGVFQPLLGLSRRALVSVDRLPLDEAGEKRLREIVQKRPLVDLVIDPKNALRRQVKLARAARGHAESAIAVQMRQLMPANGKGLVWRAHLVGATGAHLVYDVYLLKQGDLDTLQRSVVLAGGRVGRIGLAIKGVAPFMSEQARSLRARVIWASLTLILVVALAAVAALNLDQRVGYLRADNEAGAERVRALEEQIAQSSEQSSNATNRIEEIEGDLATFNRQSSPLAIIASLAETLPDDVWVSELTIEDGMVFLSAFTSGDVAGILNLLRSIDWVTSVRLRGGVIIDDYAQQSRFSVDLTTEILRGLP